MNTSRKRIVSLFLILVLILSFSSQTLATAESQVLTRKLLAESAVSELLLDTDSMPDPKLDEVCLGASGQEEEPQPEPDLKPDPKPDEVTLLGASGQETPAAGPTITPFATQAFIIVGATGNGKLMIDPITSQGTMLFVNESGISFTYSTVAYGFPYRYSTAPDWDNIVANFFTIDIVSVPEGILEYSLEAALAVDVNGSSGKPEHRWSYDNAQVNILIQRVESFTTVTGSTNPTAINVGRESVNDTDSGEPTKPPTFFWEITKDGTVILSGTDTQPDMYEVDYLPAGDYTVTTTATEYFPDAYVGIDVNRDFVTHTTTANFRVTVGNVIVEHIDADTGDAISAPETIVGTFKGDSYATKPIDNLGYALVADPANKDGFFSADDQTVTYKYNKVMTEVKVEHVYEDGTPVIPHAPTTTGHATIENILTKQLRRNDLIIIDVEVDGFSQGSTADYLATYPPSGVTTVTYMYEYKGSLILLNTPLLQFGTHVMAGTTMTYPLTQDAVLSVKDDRTAHGNWKVSVKASQFTDASGTKTLDPDALKFMDGGNFLSLKESRIIWESSTSLANPIQSKAWQEGNAGEGFVVRLSPFQSSVTSYNAVMIWSLENTP